MMTNAFKAAILDHYLNNADLPNVGDAAGLQNSAAAGDEHFSMHTASPGATGNQTTNETSYGGYARQPVSRAGTKWTVDGVTGTAINVDPVVFPAVASGGPVDISHVGAGYALSGTGALRLIGIVNSGVPVTIDVGDATPPTFPAGSIVFTIA